MKMKILMGEMSVGSTLTIVEGEFEQQAIENGVLVVRLTDGTFQQITMRDRDDIEKAARADVE